MRLQRAIFVSSLHVGSLAYICAMHLLSQLKLAGMRAALAVFNLDKAAADIDLWDPVTGAVHTGIGGTRGANLGTCVSPTLPVLPVLPATPVTPVPKKPAFTLADLQKAYAKAGIKPGLNSAARPGLKKVARLQ